MKLKWDKFFRLYLALLLIVLFWSVFRAMAQSSNTVQMVEPDAGARYEPGTDVTFRAEAGAGLGRLESMEYILDGRFLGAASNAPYAFVWTNASAGTYTLKARAVPAAGEPVESPTIHVRVYHALLTFGLDRVPLLEKTKVFQIPLWQYCASLIYIFLAFYVSKFLDYLTRVWLKRAAKKTQTKFDDLMLDLLNGPVKIIAFIIFLRIGLKVFSWPPFVQTIFAKGFTVIIAVTVTYMLLKFIDLVMGYWRERTKAEADKTFDEQLFPIIRKSLKVFIVVVAALVTLDNLDINITAAIASLSIGGLAVGLAAQDTLANLFGAVSVFVDKPFKIGDRIQMEGIDGFVESIGMRSTRVRSLDGYLITVPNKAMGNSTIINVSRRPTIKTEMNIGLTYDTPAEKVRLALKILEEIFKGHPMTANLVMSFNKFADSSLNLLVVHWWNGTDVKVYLAGLQELNLAIKERFDAAGLSFAFPTRTLYVKQDSDWRVDQNQKAG